MIPTRLRGDGTPVPAMLPWRNIALAWIGSFIAIAAVAGLGDALTLPLVLGSFGASCVLVFGFPDVPFSQPRNVVLGHLISAAVGLAFLVAFEAHWWSLAMAVGTAVTAMMITRTVHPPAGSNPVIVFLAQPGWSFLLFPVLAGAVVLVLVALAYNNSSRPGAYPKYW